MKQLITAYTGLFLCLSFSVNAQNTFPSSGSAGIGTTNPVNGKLVISRGSGIPDLELSSNTSADTYGIGIRASGGTNNSALRLMSSVGLIQLYDNSHNYGLDIYNLATLGISLHANGSSYFNGGNLGVGTATPNQILHVAKDGGTGGTQMVVEDLSTTYPGGIFVGSYQGNAYVQPSAYGKSLVFWDYTAERMRIANGGNIGINNSSPIAKLQVTNGSILFDGATGTTPVSGTGKRMMWIPSKAAFRAGEVLTSDWDDVNIGMNSFASGMNARAKGMISFATNNQTIATGSGSAAFGDYTTASGYVSTSFGEHTTASGGVSAVFGNYTTALGGISTSFGDHTTAQSYNSFVLGAYNILGTYNAGAWVATDPLFVLGNGTSTTPSNAITVLKNGYTGINNPNPQAPLHVNGNIAIGSTTGPFWTTTNWRVAMETPMGSVWKTNTTGPYMNRNLGFGMTDDGSSFGWYWVYPSSGSSGDVSVYPMSLTVDHTNFLSTLKVCGKIRVTVTGCDFVFSDNYAKMPWQEKELYYKTHKRLPYVEPAADMESNGLDIGTNFSGLLHNVEEDRLDISELYNIVTRQQEQINKLLKENEELKKK